MNCLGCRFLRRSQIETEVIAVCTIRVAGRTLRTCMVCTTPRRPLMGFFSGICNLQADFVVENS